MTGSLPVRARRVRRRALRGQQFSPLPQHPASRGCAARHRRELSLATLAANRGKVCSVTWTRLAASAKPPPRPRAARDLVAHAHLSLAGLLISVVLARIHFKVNGEAGFHSFLWPRQHLQLRRRGPQPLFDFARGPHALWEFGLRFGSGRGAVGLRARRSALSAACGLLLFTGFVATSAVLAAFQPSACTPVHPVRQHLWHQPVALHPGIGAGGEHRVFPCGHCPVAGFSRSSGQELGHFGLARRDVLDLSPWFRPTGRKAGNPALRAWLKAAWRAARYRAVATGLGRRSPP